MGTWWGACGLICSSRLLKCLAAASICCLELHSGIHLLPSGAPPPPPPPPARAPNPLFGFSVLVLQVNGVVSCCLVSSCLPFAILAAYTLHLQGPDFLSLPLMLRPFQDAECFSQSQSFLLACSDSSCRLIQGVSLCYSRCPTILMCVSLTVYPLYSGCWCQKVRSAYCMGIYRLGNIIFQSRGRHYTARPLRHYLLKHLLKYTRLVALMPVHVAGPAILQYIFCSTC